MVIGTKAKPVRFSYLHLFQPHAFEAGDTPKYSVTVLIPKNDTETIKAITEELTKLCQTEKGKTDLGKNYTFDIADFLNDGDKTDKDGYAGHYYRFIGNDVENAPERYQFVNGAVIEITTPKDIKSGDFGIVNISPYTYGKPKKGVSASLKGVLKIKDGEALGATNDSKSAFEGLLGGTDNADESDPLFG